MLRIKADKTKTTEYKISGRGDLPGPNSDILNKSLDNLSSHIREYSKKPGIEQEKELLIRVRKLIRDLNRERR